jgi:hypothetical protein
MPQRSHSGGGPMEGADLWSLKPWWCQPWSILLTGGTVILASTAAGWNLRMWWVGVLPSVLVLLWWWLFLVVAPRSYREEVLAPGGDAEPSGPVAGAAGDPDGGR